VPPFVPDAGHAVSEPPAESGARCVDNGPSLGRSPGSDRDWLLGTWLEAFHQLSDADCITEARLLRVSTRRSAWRQPSMW